MTVFATYQLCLTYQFSGLSCPAGAIARNVLVGGRWGVYPGLRGWKVERRLVIMVLKLFTLSKAVLRSAHFFSTRLDWARWDSSLVQGPTRPSGFILHKEKGHFMNQWNVHPPSLRYTAISLYQTEILKTILFCDHEPPTAKAGWTLDMVSGDVGLKLILALSSWSDDNTHLISDSVFLPVKYRAELPLFSSKILLMFQATLD